MDLVEAVKNLQKELGDVKSELTVLKAIVARQGGYLQIEELERDLRENPRHAPPPFGMKDSWGPNWGGSHGRMSLPTEIKEKAADKRMAEGEPPAMKNVRSDEATARRVTDSIDWQGHEPWCPFIEADGHEECTCKTKPVASKNPPPD